MSDSEAATTLVDYRNDPLPYFCLGCVISTSRGTFSPHLIPHSVSVACPRRIRSERPGGIIAFRRKISIRSFPIAKAPIPVKKSLGWLSLTSLGIGAVIGSGIFTIVGTAIAGQKFKTSSILKRAPAAIYRTFRILWPPRSRPGHRHLFIP